MPEPEIPKLSSMYINVIGDPRKRAILIDALNTVIDAEDYHYLSDNSRIDDNELEALILELENPK